jgi:hypothetical protein
VSTGALDLFRFGQTAAVGLVVAAVVLGASAATVAGWVLAETTPAGAVGVGETAFDLSARTDDSAPSDGRAAGSYDISLLGSGQVDELLSVLGSRTGWQQLADGPTWGTLTNGRGSFILVQTTTIADVVTPAAEVLERAFEQVVGADARQGVLRRSAAEPLAAFGNVLSRARLSYEGLQADALTVLQYRANLYAGVRNDGVVMLLEVRTYAPGDWETAARAWSSEVYRPLWEQFGGASLPSP